jgi:predicted SnoaL-like aldol condensation-catalyzing enzyme
MSNTSFIRGLAAGAAATVAISALTAYAATCEQDALEEKNKAIALEFYELALNQKDFEKAAKLIGNRYVQHNPRAADGIEGIRNHVEMLKRDFPKNRGDIKRVIADGDLVALHVHSKRTPESAGNAIVDIFRVENGKIVEHWDVVQPVPKEALNTNSMF